MDVQRVANSFFCPCNALLIPAIACLVALGSQHCRAATVVFDFEEGTFGTNWTNLSVGGDLVPNLGFSNDGEALLSGSLSLGPLPHGERDNAHDPLRVQSMPFFLDASGDLTFLTKGGTGGVIAPPLGVGAVPAGVQGMALTRASNGERVLSYAATHEATVTTITWTQAQLAPYVGQQMTLDVYDTRVGGWGWFSVDDITVPGSTMVIPEPSSIVLALLGALALVLFGWRRRRA